MIYKFDYNICPSCGIEILSNERIRLKNKALKIEVVIL